MDKGLSIEQESFEIINFLTDLSRFTEQEKLIVRKIVHTTGDAELSEYIYIKDLENGINAIKNGAPVICDVTMVASGITNRYTQNHKNEILCFINEQEVVERAKELNLTRAETAVVYAAEKYPEAVYAVGNAPTALHKIIELTKEGKMNPAFVAGLPVGFVQASESKEALMESGIPHVTNYGSKGGSPCAATVINGLFLLAAD